MWKSRQNYVENLSRLWKKRNGSPLAAKIKQLNSLSSVVKMAAFTVHLAQGSVSFRFAPEAAQALQAEIAQLTQRLKTIAQQVNQQERPTKQDALEYRYTGDVFLEVFCNPNLYASPFSAKVLLTLRDDRLRLSTETDLSQLRTDLEDYLAQI